MVKINQNISDFQEIEEGEQYQIIHVDTKVQKGFNGVNIEFVPKKLTEENKKTQYRVTAWLGQNDTVGTRSKLGAFISAFTDYFETTKDEAGIPLDTDDALKLAQDTDKWESHFIKVVSWKNKNREIKVIS
jgi:hypothetical protein